MTQPTTGNEPLDHILRLSPPWRDAKTILTECGRPQSDVASVISRQEMVAKVNRLSQARAAYTTCMTCFQTMRRHGATYGRSGKQPDPTWWNDPAGILGRDMAGYRTDTQPITDELRALGLLVRLHPDEFEDLLADVAAGDELAAVREMRLKRPRAASPRTTL